MTGADQGGLHRSVGCVFVKKQSRICFFNEGILNKYVVMLRFDKVGVYGSSLKYFLFLSMYVKYFKNFLN